MSESPSSTSGNRWPTARPGGSGTVFGLVTGLLLGVLVTALVLPARNDVEVVQGAGPAPQGAASGEQRTTGSPTQEPGSVADDSSSAEASTESGSTGQGEAVSSQGGDGSTVSSQGGDGPTAAEAAPQGTGANFPEKDERGVGDDQVTMGVALMDTGPLGYAGYDYGNPEDAYEALLDTWKLEGRLPVHGRDINFAYRQYSVLSQEEQRAACTYLIQDKKAFMVASAVLFRVGGECVAVENDTPLLISDALNEAVLERGRPYAFSLAMSDDRTLRNLAHFAHNKDLLTGPIGIYYNDSSPQERDILHRNFVAQLNELGYELAAEATTDSDDASANDALAVRQFRQAGVEVAFLFTSREGFTQAAESQAYEPRYVDSDYNYGTTDTGVENVNGNQWHETKAITGRRGGEQEAGLPPTPEQQWCAENYVRYIKKEYPDDQDKQQQAEQEMSDRNSFMFQMVMHSCDIGNSLLRALEATGPNLNHESFIAGLETFDDVPLARSGNAGFTANKHHGVDTFRTVQWLQGCRCYKAIDDFGQLYVP